MIVMIVDKAVRSLDKHAAVVTRAQWLKEAGAPLKSTVIVKYTVGRGVGNEDRQRTWADDANYALSRNTIATARAILAHSLAAFPTKRSLWIRAVDLERKHCLASRRQAKGCHGQTMSVAIHFAGPAISPMEVPGPSLAWHPKMLTIPVQVK